MPDQDREQSGGAGPFYRPNLLYDIDTSWAGISPRKGTVAHMTQRIPRKLHEQVFDSIKDMIRSGALEQGELLPSENKLAQQLGVSRVTVRWALKQLAEAGIIQTRKGKGSIVAVDWKGLLEEGELDRKSVV